MNIFQKIKYEIVKFFILPNKKQTKEFIDSYLEKMRFIEITSNAILITDLKNNIVNDIKFQHIKDATYNSENVVLFLDNNHQIEISLEYHQSWYQLIKSIPQGLLSYDYKAVADFFERLKGCDVCGLIAVDEDNKCNVCGCDVWNSSWSDEYKSKEEYLKEMQNDYFETNGDTKKIQLNNNPILGFDSYHSWVPLIKKDYYSK